MSTIVWPVYGNAYTETKTQSTSKEGRSPPRKVVKLGHPATVRSPKSNGTYSIKPITPLDPLLGSAKSALEQLKLSIREMLDMKSFPKDPVPSKSYEAIFDLCRTATLTHYQSEIHDAMHSSLTQTARLLLRNLQSDTNEPLRWLSRMVEAWAWWLRQLMIVKGVLSWLDNTTSKYDQPTIWDTGFKTFSETVMKTSTIEQTGAMALNMWLEEEHSNGTVTGRSMITRYAQILGSLGLTTSHLEEPYILWIENHYAERSLSPPSQPLALLAESLRCTEVEETLARSIFPDKVVKMVVHRTLVRFSHPHLEVLLNSTLEYIVNEKDFGRLLELHRLMESMDDAIRMDLNRDSTLPSQRLLHSFKQDAARRVKSIVNDPDADSQMVERLVELRDFYETFLNDYLLDGSDPNRRWLHALNDAFENGISTRKRKPAEMIAKSLDASLRRGQKDASDANFMRSLKKVLNLSRFTSDKDVFKAFYARGLSKRLLLGKSASDDFEKAVIGLLSREYDMAFEDMNGMFSDLTKSRDLTKSYREQCKHASTFDPALSIIVVQQSIWPITISQEKNSATQMLRLPHKLQSSLEDFTKFYKSQHQAHKLMWSYAHGTVVLSAQFPLGAKELSVSLYQAVVLLCFNEETDRTFEDIQLLVGLGDTDLILTLQSLSVGKKQILNKASPGKGVKKDDKFSVNSEFTDPKWKVHVNSIQQQETVEEIRQAERSIDHNRDGALDAAIVRIMKGSKVMKHGELVQATVEAVKKHFVPDIPAIKLRIESLAKRDFIERKDTVTWTYIA